MTSGSVLLSVCEHISETTCPIITNLCVCVCVRVCVCACACACLCACACACPPAEYAEQGLGNGRASFRPAVRLFHRLSAATAAGGFAAERRRSAANAGSVVFTADGGDCQHRLVY